MKPVFLIISLLLALSLCGCGADAVAESAATATPAATAVVTLTLTASPSPPSTTEKIEIPNFIGTMPEFSKEKNDEWRKTSKQNIIYFLENSFDKNKVLPLDEAAQDRELGVMITLVSSTTPGIYLSQSVMCQLYLLGGETRNGCWCVYFGAQDRDKNRFVFASQFTAPFGSDISTTSFSGDTFFNAVESNESENIFLSDISTNTLETIIESYQNSVLFPYFTYQRNETFESFFERMGHLFSNDEEQTRRFILSLEKCYETTKEIMLRMNLVDASILNESGSNLGESVGQYAGSLPIIDSNNIDQIENLFDNYDPAYFPIVNHYNFLTE